MSFRRKLAVYSVCLFSIMCLTLLSSNAAHAVAGRIAYSGDGNQHDRDDIGATPLGLAMLDHKGWNSKLVYYGYSDHIWDQNPAQARDMEESALGAASRFGFNRSIFYNVYRNAEKSYNALSAEINKSSAGNPLTIVAAGPMAAVCESIKRSDSSKRRYVSVLSHSSWNNNHKHGNTCTSDGIKQTGVRFIQISDQNKGVKNASGLNNPYSMWEWLKNHQNADLRWVHARMVKAFTNKADPSDSGMIWYLISGGDQNASPQKTASFFGGKAGSSSSSGTAKSSGSESSDSTTQAGGNIVIQAEDAAGRGSWVLEKKLGGYSGSGYYRWSGPDLFSSPGRDTLQYRFSVDKSGTYRVRLRAARPETGEPSDRNNDFFIRMDGGQWKKIFFSGQRNTWTFAQTFDVSHNKSPSQYSLSAGSHVLEISGRSRQAMIDSIYISGAGVAYSSSGGKSSSSASSGSSSSSSSSSNQSSANQGGVRNSQVSASACNVTHASLQGARQAFEKKCNMKYDKNRGHDCDKLDGVWVCSDHNIANAAQVTGTDTRSCSATGNTIADARQAFQNKCKIRYNRSNGHDCDRVKGQWTCSNKNIP